MIFFFKKIKIYYVISILVIDFFISKFNKLISKQSSLINNSRKIIDNEDKNLILRKVELNNYNYFDTKEPLSLDYRISLAIKYPQQYGIYNLCELVVNIFKNDPSLIDIHHDRFIVIYKLIWRFKEDTLLRNNHLLNNFRALIYLDSLNQNVNTNKLLNLVINYYEKIVNVDGISKDSSTSYSLLVTYWIADIIENLIDKKHLINNELFDNLKIKMIKSLKASKLILKCTSDNKFSIGDITPDIKARELSNKINKISKRYGVNKSFKKCDQSSIFLKSFLDSHITISRCDNTNNNIIRDHSHNDISSLTWVYNKIPILVDPGRKSYDKRFQIKDQFLFKNHNTVSPVYKKKKNYFSKIKTNYLSKSLSIFYDNLTSLKNTENYILIGTNFKIEREIEIRKEGELIIIDKVQSYSKPKALIFNWNLYPSFTKDNINIINKHNQILIKEDKYIFSDNYSSSKEALKISGEIKTSLKVVRLEHKFKYEKERLKYIINI